LPERSLLRPSPAIFALVMDRCEDQREAQRLPRSGLQPRSAEILSARSADPLIVHDLEAEALALIQAGHACAFDGAYID
jgi:hypothetical protein